MKLIKLAFVVLSISVFISGCNNNHGTKNASTDVIQQFIDDQQSGFIIITNETDTLFLEVIQALLLEKQQNALIFNVFYNDGKNKNSNGLSKNPFNFEMPTVNTIYYIKNGEVFADFDLEAYEGLRQQEELQHFLDPVNRGEVNE